MIKHAITLTFAAALSIPTASFAAGDHSEGYVYDNGNAFGGSVNIRYKTEDNFVSESITIEDIPGLGIFFSVKGLNTGSGSPIFSTYCGVFEQDSLYPQAKELLNNIKNGSVINLTQQSSFCTSINHAFSSEYLD